MRLAFHVLRAVARAALLALAVLWWAPSLLLVLAVLWGDRVRFALTMAWVDVLRGLGRQDAALRVCEAARRRCDTRMRALAGRQGWQ